MPPASTNPALPHGWTSWAPTPDDVEALVRVHAAALHSAGRPAPHDDVAEAARVLELVAGQGSWNRRQRVAGAADGVAAAWATVHDRAAGRTDVTLDVADASDTGPGHGDEIAAVLLAWAAEAAAAIARLRGLPSTQLDASAHADDETLKARLARAGYRHVRTWLQMSRPVAPADATPPTLPAGVTVRRIATHASGLPVAADLQAVHLVLEASFADHFNSYRESFPEFVARLREDSGHRWDHWWLAEVALDDGTVLPGGALVASATAADAAGEHGTYVQYIGVHRRARGRGIAKALLRAILADAASSGAARVALEVDAESPTGADGLYRSLGWETTHETESWHGDAAAATE